MKKKLRHIGIDEQGVKLLMNYLKDRKQITEINTQKSDKLLTGPISVSQGSIISGLLYTIMTLDMHGQSHPVKHKNHTEYIEYKNPEMNIYVDDTYGIVTCSNKEDIWTKIKEFIINMEEYYISNKLVIKMKSQKKKQLASITILSSIPEKSKY